MPVIKDASSLDFAAFRNAYEDLVAKARTNKLAADDLQGASFTLTNPGGIGTSASVPRLMPGQGAIIAAGAIGYPPGFTKANEASLKSLGMTKICLLYTSRKSSICTATLEISPCCVVDWNGGTCQL